jgi:glycosyltransferase involved in cell wall biosynthesis
MVNTSIKKPRVSVVMPVYNVEIYIAAALDSLLRQTFENFEVIVVDDGSTDGTVGIVKLYQQKDHRIKLFCHAINSGPSGARNTAFEHMNGEFAALLDGDDIALPNRLAMQVAALEAGPQLGIVGSHVEVINEAGNYVGNVWKRPITADDTAIQLLFRNSISNALMIRSCAIPQGGYSIPLAEDYDLNVRIAKEWKVINLNMVLSLYRLKTVRWKTVSVGLC